MRDKDYSKIQQLSQKNQILIEKVEMKEAQNVILNQINDLYQQKVQLNESSHKLPKDVSMEKLNITLTNRDNNFTKVSKIYTRRQKRQKNHFGTHTQFSECS